ncbi:hypothetical protein [Aliamphritea hakodatensis]|uniref:hypothetical protein n=1 Tax=Aliamphritea hakodatensis TaxID=2895352 RepID=UPI0022FD6542|nr:hypothetical protein [Aliamphritea hakodatensis]
MSEIILYREKSYKKFFLCCVLILMSFLAFAKDLDISDDVKSVLFDEGIEAAAAYIDSMENPSVEDMSLAVFISEAFGYDLNKYDSFKNIINYDLSESFKIKYIMDNNLYEGTYLLDMKEISKQNIFVKVLLNMISIPNHTRLNEAYNQMYVFNNMTYFIEYVDAKYRGQYSEFCDKYQSNYMMYFKVVVELGEKFPCKRLSSDVFLNMYALFVPGFYNKQEFRKLSSNNIEKSYKFFLNDSSYISDYFMKSCSAIFSSNELNYKKCALLSNISAEQCSLIYWKGINNDVLNWEGSKGFAACRHDFIKNNI